jgi:hypothetical protein
VGLLEDEDARAHLAEEEAGHRHRELRDADGHRDEVSVVGVDRLAARHDEDDGSHTVCRARTLTRTY